MSRIKSLDVLRALAVLMVLIRHMNFYPQDRRIYTIIEFITRGAWIGVDIFFVLSGFLVSGLIFSEHKKHGSISIGRFLFRRSMKIYPSYYLLLLVTYIFMEINSINGFSYLINEVLFLQSYREGVWWHTWSLAVEEHFYIILVIVVSILYRIYRKIGSHEKPFSWIPMVFFIIAASCLIWRGMLIDVQFENITHLTPSHLRLDSFFGVFIAYYYHFKSDVFSDFSKKHKRSLCAFGSMLLMPAFFIPSNKTFIYTIGYTWFYVGAGMILIGALPYTCTSRLSRCLAALGTRSYSIYVWHMALLFWLIPLLQRKLVMWWIWPLYCCLYFGGAISVGILMHHVIETPMLTLREYLWPSPAHRRQVGVPHDHEATAS